MSWVSPFHMFHLIEVLRPRGSRATPTVGRHRLYKSQPHCLPQDAWCRSGPQQLRDQQAAKVREAQLSTRAELTRSVQIRFHWEDGGQD